ncbi:MAG: DNA polymerase III subunit delta [Desulfobacterota bacterium]|nr:DNA polymerase III subunit delta [Thermodesulfobacteriota bacterium]
MKPQELERSVTAGQIAPVYIFCGDNVLLMDRAVALITTSLIPDQSAAFDLHRFSGLTASPADIVRAIRTPPFFYNKKLVIVRDAQHFKTAQWQTLSPVLTKPANRCCVVFVVQISMEDKRERSRIDTFNAYGTVVVFENPKGERQVAMAATRELARYGKKVDPEALSLLGMLLEEDALRIAREIEKLALFCGSNDTISRDDVQEILCTGEHGTLFTLADAIVQGRIRQALSLLSRIVEAGTHPLVVLKIVAQQFRHINIIHHVMATGASGTEMRRALYPLPPQAIETLSRTARLWPPENIGRVFELLFVTSMLLRSSRCDGRIVLEDLVLRLGKLRDHARATVAA